MKLRPTLLALGAAIISPIQLTIAELADMVDDKTTTVFQPDLLVSAWGQWLVIAILLFTGTDALTTAREAKKTLEENDIKPLK